MARTYRPKPCEGCGDEFTPTGSRAKLCEDCKAGPKPASKDEPKPAARTLSAPAEESGEDAGPWVDAAGNVYEDRPPHIRLDGTEVTRPRPNPHLGHLDPIAAWLRGN